MLASEHLNENPGLVVCISGEGLILPHGDSRVSFGELIHDTTRKLGSPGKRRDVKR